MRTPKTSKHPFAEPPGLELLEQGKVPPLYALLTPAEIEEKPPILKLGESRYYRSSGYEVFGPAKPLSKCFALAPGKRGS